MEERLLQARNLSINSVDLNRQENPSNSRPIPVKENDLSNLQVSNIEDAPGDLGIESEVTYSDDKENELPKSEVPNVENASRGVGIGNELTDNDDKENSSAIDANRCLNKTISEARSKIMHNGLGKVTKDVQFMDKSMKECVISVKVKKPKPTHPKPFRFRTDERVILKEAANMEKKHLLGSKAEPANPFMEGKSKRKLAKDIQGDEKLHDKCNSEIVKYSSKMPERKILAEVKSGETQEGMESAAATPNRLMQMRKMISNLKREIAQPEREAKPSLLDPAQKLNMIKEITPVTRPRKTMNRKENRTVTANTGAIGYQPSQKRLTVTIPKEPKFHTAHRPKSCTKQVV
ncbi:hypothetical protein Leryth_018318 [Lithospermum erythrorhizon]|nr:hypothetical protein Leryth_018318 [Lithospermum erythrorhizon]